MRLQSCSTNCNFEIASLSLIFFFFIQFLPCEGHLVRVRRSKMVPIHSIPMGFRFQVSRSSHRKKLYLISCYRARRGFTIPSGHSIWRFMSVWRSAWRIDFARLASFAHISRYNRHRIVPSSGTQAIPLSNRCFY